MHSVCFRSASPARMAVRRPTAFLSPGGQLWHPITDRGVWARICRGLRSGRQVAQRRQCRVVLVPKPWGRVRGAARRDTVLRDATPMATTA
jgi:hypothetical protein